MRLLILPVTSILDYPHVLLNFDFVGKMKDMLNKEYVMSSFSETVLPMGSVYTVCDLIRKTRILRALLNLSEDDDEELVATVQMRLLAIDPSKGNKTSTNKLEDFKNTYEVNSSIERLLDGERRLRFFSLGEDSDVSICAILVNHIMSHVLNANSDDRLAIEERSSIVSTITRRDCYYFWICTRDLGDKLIALHKSLRNVDTMRFLPDMDTWVRSNSIGKANKTLEDVKLLKQRYRCIVWDLMEQKQEIMYPHPCHGRIPNFRGRESAAENLAAMTTFKRSRVVKINPSLAQEHIRFLTLATSKVLITPSPALESAAPFYKIDPRFLSRKQIQRAATKAGAASLGSMVSLSGLGNLNVDLVIVGSVVVNPITGARIGKGFGYSDLEYAMMSQLGAVKDDRTVVATMVHESQLINDLPDEVMKPHDLPVNLIATPKRVIFTRCSFPKPTEVIWSEVDERMFATIPVLKDLKDFVEHKRRESACYQHQQQENQYHTSDFNKQNVCQFTPEGMGVIQ